MDVQLAATLTQTYTSTYTQPIEVVYSFPMPHDAAVHAFYAVIDGERTIEGIVMEKEEAEQTYDQAVARGQTAALVSQANVEVFQTSLGNLNPGQTIACTISFVSLVMQEGLLDTLRLTFPTAIYPRYGTPPSGISISSPPSLDLSLSVQMTQTISSISSPSHAISVLLGTSQASDDDIHSHDPTAAYISLSSAQGLTDDIAIILKCQGLDKPRCIVESFSPEEGSQEYTDAYALTFVPRFEVPPIEKQEYIFLVDRSGSMVDRGKMASVRESLQIMLKSLPSNSTTFNIVSFGTDASALFEHASSPYNEDSVRNASKHVKLMEADFGGTEMLNALGRTVSLKTRDQDVITTVFVLTDGECWDLDNVIGFVKEKVDESGGMLRMFALGLGNSVSSGMCDGIARAGKGMSVYVKENEKPHQKLMNLLRAARGVIVEDIQVDWGVKVEKHKVEEDFEIVSAHPTSPAVDSTPLSLFDTSLSPSQDANIGPKSITLSLPASIQQAPSNGAIPPMYPGFRSSILAIVKRQSDGNSAPAKIVKVRGMVLGKNVELDVPITIAAHSTAGKKVIHAIAANALIQQFEDVSGEGDGVRRAEIRRLALRYGLASKETSFVVVDNEGNEVASASVKKSRSKPVFPATGLGVEGAERHQRLPPINATFGGWPSLGGAKRYRRILPSEDEEDSEEEDEEDEEEEEEEDAEEFISVDDDAKDLRKRSLPIDTKADRMTKRSKYLDSEEHVGEDDDIVARFAGLQSFDGSLPLHAFPSLFDGSGDANGMMAKLPPGIKDDVWRTLLCVALLVVKFDEEKVVWEGMTEKAIGWIMKTNGKERDEVIGWLEEACKTLRAS